MRALVAALLIAALAACGSEGAADDTPTCEVDVTLAPTDAIAPSTITARAIITNSPGVVQYHWTVNHGSSAIEVTPRTPSSSEVDFLAGDAGIYEIGLQVSGCGTWSGTKNVRDPGANERTLRLRFTPEPGAGVPGQERVLTIPGGADYAAGVLALDDGIQVPVVVRDTGGAIVPSYVRLTSRANPDVFVELITGAAGTDAVALLPGHADVLVVPLAADRAPALIEDWTPLLSPLVVGAGAVATGVVRDPGGAPIADARVSLAVDDGMAMSTVATTAADGTFAVHYGTPGATALTVVPPRASGLPRLTASLTGVNLGAALTIRYAPALITRDLGGVAVTVDGAPAGGGHAAFAIDVTAAGTISDGTTTNVADGKHRDTVAVDATGHLTAYRVSAAAGRAYVRGASGPGAVVLFDLATAVPAGLDGGGPVDLPFTIVDDGGQPIRDAQLRAVLNGDLAHLAAAEPSTTGDSTGHATLSVAPGATYQIDVVDPRHAHAAVHLLAAAGSTPAPVELPDAIAIRGEVRSTGQSVGLAGVGVTALCYACTGLDRSRPLGDAVTDVGGGFAVAIPDPGTSP